MAMFHCDDVTVKEFLSSLCKLIQSLHVFLFEKFTALAHAATARNRVHCKLCKIIHTSQVKFSDETKWYCRFAETSRSLKNISGDKKQINSGEG